MSRFNQNSCNFEETLRTSLNENLVILKQIFNHSFDIIYQPIQLSDKSAVLLVYIEGMIATSKLEPGLLPIGIVSDYSGIPSQQDEYQLIKKHLSSLGANHTTDLLKDVVDGILQANVAVLFEGVPEAVLVGIVEMEHRGVEEPSSENAIRGPRDSFTETIGINTTMIRKRIKSPHLKLESLVVGKLSQTKIALAYIEGIASDSIVQLARERLSRIHIDAVLESGYLEEFIEDKSFSPFPQIQNTERPDIAVASLLEGKVAILTDGTPYVLIAPMTFWTAFQSVEDYYERFIYSTLIRWSRFILFIVSLYLPSLFVAITTFHPQLLPTNFLLSITSAREGVPFPSVIEALLMEFLFEGLREAGVRLPKAVGSAVSIVGALVIGQAAVQAGIVSAPMVIIVSMTGIASFAIPRYNMGIAFRILRFPLLVLSGGLGLYGIAMGSTFILIHLAKLKSFGVPYLSPVAPLSIRELKDTLIRAPRWDLQWLPSSITGWLKRRKYGK